MNLYSHAYNAAEILKTTDPEFLPRHFKHAVRHTYKYKTYEEMFRHISNAMEKVGIEELALSILLNIERKKWQHPLNVAISKTIRDLNKEEKVSTNKTLKTETKDTKEGENGTINIDSIILKCGSLWQRSIIFLLSRGYSKREISDYYGIDRKSVRKIVKKALSGLMEDRRGFNG